MEWYDQANNYLGHFIKELAILREELEKTGELDDVKHFTDFCERAREEGGIWYEAFILFERYRDTLKRLKKRNPFYQTDVHELFYDTFKNPNFQYALELGPSEYEREELGLESQYKSRNFKKNSNLISKVNAKLFESKIYKLAYHLRRRGHREESRRLLSLINKKDAEKYSRQFQLRSAFIKKGKSKVRQKMSLAKIYNLAFILKCKGHIKQARALLAMVKKRRIIKAFAPLMRKAFDKKTKVVLTHLDTFMETFIDHLKSSSHKSIKLSLNEETWKDVLLSFVKLLANREGDDFDPATKILLRGLFAWGKLADKKGWGDWKSLAREFVSKKYDIPLDIADEEELSFDSQSPYRYLDAFSMFLDFVDDEALQFLSTKIEEIVDLFEEEFKLSVSLEDIEYKVAKAQDEKQFGGTPCSSCTAVEEIADEVPITLLSSKTKEQVMQEIDKEEEEYEVITEENLDTFDWGEEENPLNKSLDQSEEIKPGGLPNLPEVQTEDDLIDYAAGRKGTPEQQQLARDWFQNKK